MEVYFAFIKRENAKDLKNTLYKYISITYLSSQSNCNFTKI